MMQYAVYLLVFAAGFVTCLGCLGIGVVIGGAGRQHALDVGFPVGLDHAQIQRELEDA